MKNLFMLSWLSETHPMANYRRSPQRDSALEVCVVRVHFAEKFYGVDN